MRPTLLQTVHHYQKLLLILSRRVVVGGMCVVVEGHLLARAALNIQKSRIFVPETESVEGWIFRFCGRLGKRGHCLLGDGGQPLMVEHRAG